jgi:thioredoxin-like negative regulator of GroEL
MIKEMPSNFGQIKFAAADADQVPTLVDHFKIDAVPSVILLHPHKQTGEVI